MADAARPTFDYARLERQLHQASLAKVVLIGGFLMSWTAYVLGAFGNSPWPVVAMIAASAGWVFASIASARMGRLTQRAGEILGGGPTAQAEALIHEAMGRFTLYRNVRVMLYHHLAVLRHRQARHDEVSMICSALLTQRDLRQPGGLRNNLLLMFAEARLAAGDLLHTYAALASLYQQQLTLVESLQLLAIQARYETACGHDQHVLQHLAAKVEMVELMPPAASAQVYEAMADAADRLGRQPTAAWLRERADLLAPPAERRGSLAIAPTGPDTLATEN